MRLTRGPISVKILYSINDKIPSPSRKKKVWSLWSVMKDDSSSFVKNKIVFKLGIALFWLVIYKIVKLLRIRFLTASWVRKGLRRKKNYKQTNHTSHTICDSVEAEEELSESLSSGMQAQKEARMFT